jgi:(p)ppGpp synthase/HD superfamily hydrolase
MTKLPPAAQDAAAIAVKAHGDQKYGDKPYSWHLDRVAEVVARHSGDIADQFVQAMAGAYLHDVIEDVPNGARFLDNVDPSVIEAVRALSKSKGQTPEQYYTGIKNAGRIAIAVKIADRIANMQASLSAEMNNHKKFEKYRSERHVFASMRQGDDLKNMWDELDKLYDGKL